jgi:predicted Zn-dependent protease with MMP-like domain
MDGGASALAHGREGCGSMTARNSGIALSREEFEEIAQEIFDDLPPVFGEEIDNVHVVVDDYPSAEICEQMRVSPRGLLGLYQGVPLTQRGTWYGMSPTLPDRIWLFQKNIESECTTEEELFTRIQEVLLHEIGHYFGMSEAEIRRAMKRFFR